MWLQGKQCYEEEKRNLEGKRRRLEKLLEDKNYQLDPEDFVLFGEGQIGPILRIFIGDCSAHVRDVLKEHFHILPVEIEDVEPSQSERLPNIQRLLRQSSAFTDLEAQQIAEISLQAGSEALQIASVSSAIAHFNSGLVLLQEKALQTSTLWPRLSNSLALTYYQAGKYAESMDICEKTMKICSNCPSEWLTALFYFTLSNFFSPTLRQLDSPLLQQLAEMTSSPSTPQNPLISYINAFNPTYNDTEMATKLEEGLALGQPQSYPTACARLNLGILYLEMGREGQAEAELGKAWEALEARFPFSSDFGMCLNALGKIDVLFRRYEQAESRMRQAYQLLTHFPQSAHFYTCVHSLHQFYSEQDRPEEALSAVKAAIQIWQLNNDHFHVKECRKTLQIAQI